MFSKLISKILITITVTSLAPSLHAKNNDSNDILHAKITTLAISKGEAMSLVAVAVLPENFKPINTNKDESLLEYIPRNDQNPHDWSEMITFKKSKAKNTNAKKITDDLAQRFAHDKSYNAKIKKFEAVKLSNELEQSEVEITYDSKQGRQEIMFARYFCGPMACAGMQYSMPAGKNSDKSLDIASNYIKNNFIIAYQKITGAPNQP